MVTLRITFLATTVACAVDFEEVGTLLMGLGPSSVVLMG